jgi:putative membrane protein
MAFIDFLALQEALLLIATAIVGFVGLSAHWAMRQNDAAGVKSALKSGAVPIGGIGAVATTLAVWAETTWPFPAIPGTDLASYNILFTDVYLLFGLTLVILAVTMAFHLKLAYAGLFAFVAGAVTMGYGWNGYILHMTKEPLQTLLLYLAFGGVGIFSFPATLMTDHFLAHPDGTAFAFGTTAPVARSRPSFQGASRAAQPVVPGLAPETSEPVEPSYRSKFHLPAYVTAYTGVFLVIVGLAGYAAFAYLLATLPGHLISAP